MKLYFESALRIKLRLAICALLVFGLAWSALYMSKAGDYSSAATVWVEKPLYFQSDPSNNYISPATTQANILGELLRTKQFTLAVAQEAKIPIPSREGEDRLVGSIQRALTVETFGMQLVRIKCTGGKDNYCKELITQTIKLFVKEINTNRARQAQVALQLYEQQRATYEQQMTKSREAYDKYIRDNPEASASTLTPNPTLMGLQQQYVSDRARYDEVANKISDISTQSSAAAEANNSFFRVMDPAVEAEPYAFSTKDLLRNSMVAFIMALCAVVAVTLVSTWVDPAVYTVNDVQPLLQAESEELQELLISVIPYNKALAANRQRADKESRLQSKGARRPSNANEKSGKAALKPGETSAS